MAFAGAGEKKYSFVEVENQTLKEQLREFKRDSSVTGVYPAIMMYTSLSKGNEADTVTYLLLHSSEIADFIDNDLIPKVDYVSKVDDFIIGVVENEGIKSGHKITSDEMLSVLKSEFPVKFDKVFRLVRRGYAFITAESSEDDWTLKFVNDSLVSKKIMEYY